MPEDIRSVLPKVVRYPWQLHEAQGTLAGHTHQCRVSEFHLDGCVAHQLDSLSLLIHPMDYLKTISIKNVELLPSQHKTFPTLRVDWPRWNQVLGRLSRLLKLEYCHIQDPVYEADPNTMAFNHSQAKLVISFPDGGEASATEGDGVRDALRGLVIWAKIQEEETQSVLMQLVDGGVDYSDSDFDPDSVVVDEYSDDSDAWTDHFSAEWSDEDDDDDDDDYYSHQDTKALGTQIDDYSIE